MGDGTRVRTLVNGVPPDVHHARQRADAAPGPLVPGRGADKKGTTTKATPDRGLRPFI
jgi:hypothetical protein